MPTSAPPPSDHWFEPVADHLGGAYLRYSFTKGTDQEVGFLVDALGLRAGHAGARRRVRTRTPRPRAGGAGPRGRRRRHQPAFRRPGDAGRPARRHVRAGRRPGARRSTPSSTPPSRSARAPSASPAGPGRRSTATATCSAGIARALRPGGVAAVSAFSAYFQVRYLEDTDRFDADAGVNHERTEVRDERRRGRPRSTCGPRASRRASCGCWPPGPAWGCGPCGP